MQINAKDMKFLILWTFTTSPLWFIGYDKLFWDTPSYLLLSSLALGLLQWLLLWGRSKMTPKWVLATALGWTLGWWTLALSVFVLFYACCDYSQPSAMTEVKIASMSGLIGGGVCGTLQYFLLRQKLNKPRRWVFITMLVWSLGFLLVFKTHAVDVDESILLMALPIGFVTGVAYLQLEAKS